MFPNSISPPILKRPRWLVAILTTVFFLVWIAAPFITSRVPSFIYFVSPLLLFLPLAWLRIREARTRRLLRESGYRLCIHCGHSLAGLGDDGRCPECGRAYVIDADREIWAASELATRSEMRDSRPS